MDVPNESLIALAVAGDESALTALLEGSGPQVRSGLERSYRRRLAGQVDLDDVMQVTYLEAFLRIRDFVPAGSNAFRAWLGRIAENNLRDAIRKSDATNRRASIGGGSSETDRAVFEPAARGATPGRAAGRDEAGGLLEAALQQLPEDYERVLRLYDLEGHSGPKVALMMNRSHGAVKMLVARARNHLNQLLGSASKFFSHTA